MQNQQFHNYLLISAFLSFLLVIAKLEYCLMHDLESHQLVIFCKVCHLAVKQCKGEG